MTNHLLLIDASGFARLPDGAKALYELTFPNGKRYIGMTNNLKRRRQRHKDQTLRGSPYPVHRAIRHYGLEAVTMRVIAVGPADYISEIEAIAVEAFGLRDPANGYNILPGGGANPMDNPEIARRVGDMLLGRKNPPEVREKKGASRWTPEARAAVSKVHKGKVITEEHKALIRAASKARLGGRLPKRRKRTPEELAIGRENRREKCRAVANARWARVRASRGEK